MKLKILMIVACLIGGGIWIAQHFHKPGVSQYAGQEQREIKSLSQSDIDELRSGAGWGLAKAAELNGVPGPVHLLEMKDKIALTPDQVTKITEVYELMRSEAQVLGEQLIERERVLEEQFRDGSVTEASLQTLLAEISQTRTQLRFAHLSAHLKTPKIVSADQIEQYNTLRGYGSGDPCANVPEGHNAAMWRKHNGCS